MIAQGRNIYAIEFEDIALLRGEWIITSLDKNGQPVVIKGQTSEVVRKQKDGTWLYIVDHPFGSVALD